MDRKTYIDLCINAARKIGLVLRPKDVEWQSEDLCEHDGIVYYPVAYRLTFDRRGNALHGCELHDLRANSITVARLCDVHAYKKESEDGTT